MKEILSMQAMAAMDRRTQKEYGMSELVCVENAGRSAWENIWKNSLEELLCGGGQHRGSFRVCRVALVVLCGTGNNGADGYVVARHAWLTLGRCLNVEADIMVPVLSKQKEDLTGANYENMCILEKYFLARGGGSGRGEFILAEDLGAMGKCAEKLGGYDKVLIIDALLGTGFHGMLRGAYAALIAWTNACREKLQAADLEVESIALDIPTGLSLSPRKEGLGKRGIFSAGRTIAFETIKDLCLTPLGRMCCGALVVVRCGFPLAADDKNIRGAKTWSSGGRLIEEGDMEKSLRRYGLSDYKGRRGRVFVIAGSAGMLGAGILATRAATHTGAGLTTLWCRSSDIEVQSARLINEMLRPLDSFDAKVHLGQCGALLLGPGLPKVQASVEGSVQGSEHEAMNKATDKVTVRKEDDPWMLWGEHVAKFERASNFGEDVCPALIVDAGGFSYARAWRELGIWDKIVAHFSGVIFTAHLGELADLGNVTLGAVSCNPQPILKRVGEEYSAIVLCKASCTMVYMGASEGNDERTAFIDGQNPLLGTAGSGDILAGMITALAAYEFNNAKEEGGNGGVQERLFRAAWMGVKFHQEAGRIAAGLGRNEAKLFPATRLLPAISRVLGKSLSPS